MSLHNEDAVFVRDGAHILPNTAAAGPWDPGLMHGGAPSSLLAWTAENVAAPMPMQLTRLTIDLMRPAPIAPLTIRSEIVREGRNIQVLALEIEADGKVCVRASALRVRAAPLPDLARTPELTATAPEAAEVVPFFANGFGSNFDVRLGGGVFRGGGAAAVWFRLKRPLIKDEATTPIMRAAATADFGNGVSSSLDFQTYTYINADLDLSFARAPQGEWMLLDAETWVGDAGRGFATSRLGDAQGYFGRGLQNLVISRRA